MRDITDAQDLFLRIIGASGEWNAFQGPVVEAALRANTDLWRSALFTREASPIFGDELRSRVDLLTLRDLPQNHVSLDTLFLLAEPGRQSELEVLASQWGADEVDWVNQKEAFKAMGVAGVRNKDYIATPEQVILRVWWD
ncbi:MAG: hypothetical protein EHM45_17805 [Desulfobacteraceae bacterium]|nr:MAG: hypothetical protein EHM45_17805 [Desulfobacteraceae bacterium]